jgi:hypothetical protein
MIRGTGLLFFLVTVFVPFLFAQQHFNHENTVYLPQVKTVQCYNGQKEQSMPVIQLNSDEQLLFSFDDLDAGTKDYWYTIEHCTSDWKPSGISPIDYLKSFTEDRITNYGYSSNTLQKFTHYTLKLPNEQVSPRISGNYLLKVYLNQDPDKPVISQRFYVLDNQVNVGIELTTSTQVPLRTTNQKLNFTIFHSFPVQNPFSDIKAVVMQNGIPQTALTNTKPTYVKPGSLIYNDVLSNDFSGGNEFRKFDLRSFRYKTEQVERIDRDTTVTISLFPDRQREGKYAQQFDENGNFYIRDQDGRDNDTESDYADVLFTLDAVSPTSNGKAYIVGRFNNYVLNDQSSMRFDAGRKQFTTKLRLKQGLYDYKYFWVDGQTGKLKDTVFEGSYFETENFYQVFVYFRKPGGRWDELIGYGLKSR